MDIAINGSPVCIPIGGKMKEICTTNLRKIPLLISLSEGELRNLIIIISFLKIKMECIVTKYVGS